MTKIFVAGSWWSIKEATIDLESNSKSVELILVSDGPVSDSLLKAVRIEPMGEWVSKEKGFSPKGVRYVCSSLYKWPYKLCVGDETFYGENAEEQAVAAWNTRSSNSEEKAKSHPKWTEELLRSAMYHGPVAFGDNADGSWTQRFVCSADERLGYIIRGKGEAIEAPIWLVNGKEVSTLQEAVELLNA